MLDAGTGMFRAGEHLATAELDIFLSHVHLDHVIGLTYLFDVQSAHPLRRVTVHAAADELAAIDATSLPSRCFPSGRLWNFGRWPRKCPWARADGSRIFLWSTRAGSRGYRLDWPGHSMAYVTDTTARTDADYVDKIRGVDLLVHECYFRDEEAATGRLKTGP